MNTPTASPNILVAQTGARMHYAVAVLLHRSGYLDKLVTDAYAGDGSWLAHPFRVMPESLMRGGLRRLSQRKSSLPSDKVVAFNRLGIQYARAMTVDDPAPTYTTDVVLKYSREFLEKVATPKLLATPSAVFAYCGASLELFEAAKPRGITCIQEQMTIPVSKRSELLTEERRLWPNWQHSGAMAWQEDLWIPRESAERELADVIVAPSSYVRDELINVGVSPSKIVEIPYAVDVGAFTGELHQYDGKRPLRIVFVGSVNLRKGIPYLLEALATLGPDKVEARIVGSQHIGKQFLQKYDSSIQFVGRVAREEVINHYRWADIFVMPSIAEGSATVTYEARACGLPIIATPNTGAWIENNVDGIEVPLRDIPALVQTLQKIIDNPYKIEQMSHAALENAPNFSWDAYQGRLKILAESLEGRKLDRAALVEGY